MSGELGPQAHHHHGREGRGSGLRETRGQSLGPRQSEPEVPTAHGCLAAGRGVPPKGRSGAEGRPEKRVHEPRCDGGLTPTRAAAHRWGRSHVDTHLPVVKSQPDLYRQVLTIH